MSFNRSPHVYNVRVIFLTNSFPKPSETFIMRQVVGLLESQHDVRVIAAESSTEPVRHKIVAEYGLKALTTYLPIPHDPVSGVAAMLRSLPIATAHSTELLESFRRGPTGIVRLACLRHFLHTVAGWDPDIIHAHFGGVGARWDFVPTVSDIPFVTSFYGMDASSQLQADPDRFKILFDRADALTVLSGDMRSDLIASGCPQEKTNIIPLPVDIHQFGFAERTPPDQRPIRIATVARLVEKKGIDDALRAFASVAADHNVTYDLVGDGPLRSDLDALADALDVKHRVNFHGFVSSLEVSQILSETNLFLHPSKVSSDGSKEGTPTAIIEALAMGLPVVSTRHAGIPSIVQDNEMGLLVPEGDVSALANALRSLVKQPERWGDMGRSGRLYVEANHSISAVSERLIDLYEDVGATRG